MADVFCIGCDIPFPLNEQGLCEDCAQKLERDLIRARDWDYTGLVMSVPEWKYEEVRLEVIRQYGADYELIVPPKSNPAKKKQSPLSNLNLPPKQKAGTYTEADVVDLIQSILLTTEHYMWVELGEVGKSLGQCFEGFSPKQFGYKSLRRLVQAHPRIFQTRWENPKKKRQSRIFIRLTKDHTRDQEDTE